MYNNREYTRKLTIWRSTVNPKEYFLWKNDLYDGGRIAAVLSIHDPEEALLYYRGYVNWLKQDRTAKRGLAEEIAKESIGWCFGEGMPSEDIKMWIETTGAYHPAFGTRKPEDPQILFQMGVELGERLRRGENFESAQRAIREAWMGRADALPSD
jgi:hypothetical protein